MKTGWKRQEEKKARTKTDESKEQGDAPTNLERIENALLASNGNEMDTFGGEGAVEKLLLD